MTSVFQSNISHYKELLSQYRAGEDSKEQLDLLNQLVPASFYIHPEQASQLADRYLELALKYRDNRRIVSAYICKGWMFTFSGFFKESIETLEKCESYFRKDVPSFYEAYANLIRARAYINQNQIEKAQTCLDRTAELSEHYEENYWMGMIVHVQGIISSRQLKLNEALQCFLMVINTLEKNRESLNSNFLNQLGQAYHMAGRTFLRLENIEKGVDYIQKSIEIFKQIPNNLDALRATVSLGFTKISQQDFSAAKSLFKSILAQPKKQNSKYSYNNSSYGLAITLREEKKYTEALKLLEPVTLFYKEINSNYNYCLIKGEMVHLNLDADQPEEALLHFDEIFDICKKFKYHKTISDATKVLSEYFARIKDYKKAYQFHVLYDKYAELFYNDKIDKIISDIEIKYEKARQQAEDEKLQLQTLTNHLAALQSQSNIHFIFNALTSIQQFIGTNDAETAEKFLLRFSRLMKYQFGEVQTDFVSLHKEVLFVEDYLLLEKLRFKEEVSFNLFVEPGLETSGFYIPPLIIQPYIENAIKHGIRPRGKGKVQVIFKKFDKEYLECLVIDDGVGIEPPGNAQKNSSEHISMGRKITNDRMKILRNLGYEAAAIFTENYNEALENPGTKVTIILPLKRNYQRVLQSII